MSNTPRALGGFPILALHPKALRQIGNLCFSERTPEELTNLSWEVRFFCGERGGDRSIGEANLRKGRSPFYGWRPCRPLQWKRHRRPPSLFIKKHCAKSGKPGFFGTNSGSINEPLMGGSFFVGERGGDRSIGEANLRKGRQPLQWKRHCRLLLWKRHCRPLQWERYCRPPGCAGARQCLIHAEEDELFVEF